VFLFIQNFEETALTVILAIILIPSSLFFIYFAIFYVIRKVIISERGVEYITPLKRYLISWDEMQDVGVLPFVAGRNHVFYFTSINPDELDHYNVKLSGRYFRMIYRKKAEEEIKKYWHRPIKKLCHPYETNT